MRFSLFSLFLFFFISSTKGQGNYIELNQHAKSIGEKKLAPDLFQLISQKKVREKEAYRLLVGVTDWEMFKRNHMHNPNLQMLSEYNANGSVQIKVNGNWLQQAVLDTNIQFISNARKPFTERELTGFDLSLNSISAAHANWPTINGEGITVSIKEQLLDTLDIDFKGRYLAAPMASKDLQTHATTMATIVAGGGNSFYTGKGVAWGANISNADFSNLLPDNLAVLQKLKVGVQNHSYGVGIENYYGTDAQAYDAQMNQDTSLMHIFSAGNMGNQSSTSGLYAGIVGYANLTGSFKMSKNSLAIGATDLFNQTVSFSSRGPAFDGRVKPELVALGEDGSSGAAAIVSGISLLLKDAWAKKNPLHSIASSALLKAVLINTADDIGVPEVDFIAGFGAVNAKRALHAIIGNKIIQAKITPNQIQTYPIQIPSNIQTLKLTIAWIDPPANPNSSRALVNDLDIELIEESTGTVYLPWVLNHQPALSSLSSPAIRGRDSINNVEQITVHFPASGNYQIRVRGSKLTTIEQPYTIVWDYDISNQFQFTFPVKGTQLIPNTPTVIRWETNKAGTATLQYQLDGGAWETISNQVDISKQYFQWVCPNQIGFTQIRIIQNGFSILSDTVIMAPIVSLQTGFNCSDSFMLSWPKVNTLNYQLYKLSSKYMEPDLVTADTLVIKSKLNNPNQVYSVAPIVFSGFNNYRGYAQNYNQQELDCYIKGFVADPSGVSNATLRLEIGTNYLVQKVEFEKRTATGYQSIQNISPVSGTVINRIVPATNGLNIFRAKLTLVNGQQYYSTPSQVLVFGEQPYYLFPNPIQNGESLQLMSENIDSTFVIIIDSYGRKVHHQFISSYIEKVKLPFLSKGVYYAIINRNGMIQKKIPFIISQ